MESLTITQDAESETDAAKSAHEAQMVKAVDDAQAAADAASQADATPAADSSASAQNHIPEKFRGAADPVQALAEAYAALEQKQAAGDKPAEDAKSADAKEGGDAAETAWTDDPAQPIPMESLEEEYYANDKSLTDATYEALEKRGITRAQADGFIAAQEAQNELMIARVGQALGGDDQIDATLAWMKTGMSKADALAHNAVIEQAKKTNDVTLAVTAMREAHAKMVAATGKAPTLVTAEAGTRASADVFESTEQVTEAMRDPRYKTDPAYRKSVAAKLERSHDVFSGRGY